MHKTHPYQGEPTGVLGVEDRIDAICDRFEQARASGDEVDLTSYLEHCEPHERSRLFVELLLVEFELSEDGSFRPEWDKYLARFPEYATQIEAIRFRLPSTIQSSLPTDAGLAVPTPDRVAHFQLLSELGAGASATVWKAWDTKLRRLVAVKIPRVALASDAEANRFLREGWAAAQLRHAGIVTVHDVGRDGNTAYIVSDYIVGTTLKEHLRDCKLLPRKAAELCLAIAQALQHAHDKQVIHRDLKPANILLDEAGKPLIADFGLAKWSQDDVAMTVEGQVLGTPAYMSPEQARGQAGQADGRADVYALGVLLFEMLTGRRPFEADTHTDVLFQILNHEPPAPRTIDRSIPRDLETICVTAMEKEAGRRYATAAAMAEDLQRFLQGAPILARRPSLPAKIVRAMRRRPALAIAVAMAMMAAAAIGLAGKLSRDNRKLLGLTPVSLVTEPSGAQVTFVPLHKHTGRPQPGRLVRAPGKTPLQQELSTGEYLVIVTLNDGRFHEVRRRVPEPSEIPGQFPHQRWQKSPDGTVGLPSITIPEKDVISGMALIAPAVLSETSGEAKVAPFYVDPAEFTVAQYTAQADRLPYRRWKPVPPNYPATLSFDEAVIRAERLGKRLPTEEEYEQAVRCLSPAEVNLGEVTVPYGIGPVDQKSPDRTATDPPVQGLVSNVAEWTTSTWNEGAGTSTVSASDFFVVRGGSRRVINGETELGSEDYLPDLRTNTSRNTVQPGLGFRCVRSAAPSF